MRKIFNNNSIALFFFKFFMSFSIIYEKLPNENSVALLIESKLSSKLNCNDFSEELVIKWQFNYC